MNIKDFTAEFMKANNIKMKFEDVLAIINEEAMKQAQNHICVLSEEEIEKIILDAPKLAKKKNKEKKAKTEKKTETKKTETKVATNSNSPIRLSKEIIEKQKELREQQNLF